MKLSFILLIISNMSFFCNHGLCSPRCNLLNLSIVSHSRKACRRSADVRQRVCRIEYSEDRSDAAKSNFHKKNERRESSFGSELVELSQFKEKLYKQLCNYANSYSYNEKSIAYNSIFSSMNESQATRIQSKQILKQIIEESNSPKIKDMATLLLHYRPERIFAGDAKYMALHIQYLNHCDHSIRWLALRLVDYHDIESELGYMPAAGGLRVQIHYFWNDECINTLLKQLATMRYDQSQSVKRLLYDTYMRLVMHEVLDEEKAIILLRNACLFPSHAGSKNTQLR